ncbi:MAG: putative Ig domain-containing protein [Acidobacteriota bacterium]
MMRNANGCTQRGASIRIAGTLSVLALTFVPVSAAAPDGARAAAMEAFRAGRGVAARTDGRWHLLPSRPATAATRASSPGSPSATLLFQRPNQADAQLSDIECDLCGGFNQAIAENFVVSNGGAGATVGSATFWGVYAFNNTAPPSDSFTVILHNDLAGLPGTTRCTFGPLSPTRVATGVIATGQNLDEYMYTVTLPGGCFLPDGTYWIEIFDDTTVDPDDDDWFWETGIQDFARGLPDFALASEAPGVNWTSSAGADEELSLVLVDASSTCREPALAIPDNNAGGVNDTLSVAAGGIITDVNVSIVATHTRVGDLDFRLTHVPTGTQVIILDRPGVPPAPGCAGNDMDVVLDDAATAGGDAVCGHRSDDPRDVPARTTRSRRSPVWTRRATGRCARGLNTGEVGTLDQWCLLFTYCPNITVNPGSPLPPGTTGTPYSATFTGSGGTAPYTFTVTAGALPPGLALNGATGVLSGTPTAQGTYNFTIRATDVNGCFGARAYTLVISCGTITLAPAALPNGTLGVPYSQTITASGGTPPYVRRDGRDASDRACPERRSVLSRTPTAAGTFNSR